MKRVPIEGLVCPEMDLSLFCRRVGGRDVFEVLDVAGVFPAKFLEKKKGVTASRARDCVLNRTLIDRTTNQMISDRAPSKYLAEIRQTPGFPFDAVLASHCLPTGAKAPFWSDDYDAFLAWREKHLWQEIQRVTGATEATDLEAEEAETA